MKNLIFILFLLINFTTFAQSARDTIVAHAFDSDGTIASYIWAQKSGPAKVNIATVPNHPDSAIINYTVAGTYIFTCRVVDNQGAMDTSNATQTTVISPAINNPPSVEIVPSRSKKQLTK